MKPDSTDIVDRILSEDVESIARAIREVEAKLLERRNLARDLMRELGEDISDLQSKEDAFSIWGPGYRHSVDRTRDSIRSQISLLKSETRNVELNFFRDSSALEKELRLLVTAYERALRKKRLLED